MGYAPPASGNPIARLWAEKADLSDVVAGVIDVTRRGAKGNGTTDDYAAIQAAINTAPLFSTIYFPGGIYAVSAGLRLRPDLRYIGQGGRSGLTQIKALAGLSGALMAAAGWWDNANSVGRMHVDGFHLDAAAAPGAHGLIAFSFWSTYRDVQVAGCSGAGIRSFAATDRCRNGTTITTSSHSENRFEAIRVQETSNNADGFYQESVNGYSNQDGHLAHSYLASCAGDAIALGRAAGWTVFDNHTYGTGRNAIIASLLYGTKIIDNYVEDFGLADAAGGYYNGIAAATVLDGRPSEITGNMISVVQPATPTGARWTCLYARAGSGQQKASLVITGNSAVALGTAPNTKRSHAYWLGEGGDTGRSLAVQWGDNQTQETDWWQGRRTVAANASVVLSEPSTNYAQPNAPANPIVGTMWLDTDEDAGTAPAAFPSMAGAVASAPAISPIVNGASAPATPTAVDHLFATPVAGRITIRVNGQFAPLTGEGYANRAQTSPVLVGVALVSGDGVTVLAQDIDWSEGYTLDNGYGLYGQCNLTAELFYDAVLPAGTYRARLLCWSFRGDTTTPRVLLSRAKTKWLVVP